MGGGVRRQYAGAGTLEHSSSERYQMYIQYTQRKRDVDKMA